MSRLLMQFQHTHNFCKEKLWFKDALHALALGHTVSRESWEELYPEYDQVYLIYDKERNNIYMIKLDKISKKEEEWTVKIDDILGEPDWFIR